MNFDQVDIATLRAKRGEKWRQYPSDILPAWVADMDFEIAPQIREAIEAQLQLSDCGYPVSPRDTGLPEIFCERVAKQFDWDLSPQDVDLFNDVVQAIYFALLALGSEGDGVVIQTPIYPPFMSSTKATGRESVLCPLSIGNNGFGIDMDAMRRAITQRTKILLLCNPHNPTGRCFTETELKALAELALEHNLFIVSDEIHADLVYTPHRHIPIASLSDEVRARTVTLMSASKAFNMAGICLAFAVYGSEALRAKFNQVPRHLRGGISALSIAGVTAAFTQAQPWLDEVVKYLRANRDFLAEHAATKWPRARHFVPEATYLAWFDFNAYDLNPNPYQYLLENAKVALSDGARFGEPGRGYVRINFATSREILTEILSRIDRALPA